MVKQILLGITCMHSLNLLNLVYISFFFFGEAELQNAEIVIVELQTRITNLAFPNCFTKKEKEI